MPPELGFVPSSGAPSGAGSSPAAPTNTVGFVSDGSQPNTSPTNNQPAASSTPAVSGSSDPFQSVLNAVQVPTLFPASQNDNPIEAGLKTAGNFAGSAVNVGLSLAKLPFQGVHDIGADLSGFGSVASNMGGGIEGYIKAAATLAENIPGAAYEVVVPQSTQQAIAGNTTGAGNTIENDPVGQILPYFLVGREAAYKISPEAGAAFDSGITKVAQPVETVAGKTGSLIGGTGNILGGMGRFVVGQATGLFPKTIESITDNPGEFSKEGMGATTRPAVAATIKDALDARIADLEETGKGYQAVRQSGSTVPVDPEYLKNTIQQTTGLKVMGDGNVDSPYKLQTSGASAIRNPGDISALQNKIMNVWSPEFAKGFLTPDEFLNFRKDLGDMAKYEGGIGKSSALQNLADVMRGKFNTAYRDAIPGLAERDANFSSQIGELNQLKKGVLDNDGNLSDAGINRIANATNKGRSVYLTKLEEIAPGITSKIKILKAIEDIENAEGQKVGTYARTGKELIAGGAGFATGGPVGAVAAAIVEAILASPGVAVPLLRAYGYSSELVSSVLSGLKTLGSKINDSTIGAGPIAPQVPKALSSAGDFLQDHPPGLSIKDVSETASQKSVMNTVNIAKDKMVGNIQSTIDLYKKWQTEGNTPVWARGNPEALQSEISSMESRMEGIKNGTEGPGFHKVTEPIEIEHRTDGKMKYSPATGAYFGKPGDVDEGFGHIVMQKVIKPGSTIFEFPNSYDFLDHQGYLDTRQGDLIKKYGNELPQLRKSPTLRTLWDNADELSNPGVAYAEAEQRVVGMIKRAFNPDVILFTSEDDLVPEQYVVQNLNALEDKKSKGSAPLLGF